MKLLQLTQHEACTLVQVVEQSNSGINIGDLRKLDAFLKAFTGVEPYRATWEMSDEEGRDGLRADVGDVELKFEVEDAHLDVVKRIWSQLQFVAQPKTRGTILAIDEVLNGV